MGLSRRALGSILLLTCLVSVGRAQSRFVYTNNDGFHSRPNTVTGFAIAPDGSLAELPNSPFATGGLGTDGVSSRHSIVVTGDYLFVSNQDSFNVSGFLINASTGSLTAIPGSPFRLHGRLGAGHSLAATPDGRYLMVAVSNTGEVLVFRIGANGALTPIPGSPFSIAFSLVDIVITPDGQFMIIAGARLGQPVVDTVRIASDGSLTPIPGSGPSGESFFPLSLTIGCGGSFVYVGAAENFTTVYGLRIDTAGQLSLIPGSPFSPGIGRGSGTVFLTPDGRLLFVANDTGKTVTAFRVAPDGTLALVAGSPFSSTAGPLVLATNQDATSLFASSSDFPSVSVFRIAPSGALAQIPGSPFPVNVNAGFMSLAVYPAISCADLPLLSLTCPSPLTIASAQVQGCSLGASVSYAPPVATGGCSAAAVSCVPASGSFFPVGSTTVTCTATDTCGNSASCTFPVTVSSPFAGGGVCLIGDGSGDTFNQVTNSASTLYRWWFYRVAATGEMICGRANSLSYIPARSLVSYDNDYSAENPSFSMNANINFAASSGTVQVVDRRTGRQYVLRDRDLRNNPPCQ